MSKLVSSVDAAIAHVISLGPMPSALSVAATGRVSSTGWSGFRLRPRIYAAPPADGFQEFDFLGDPPFGPFAQAGLPVGALYLGPKPSWLQGVRVIAETNSVQSGVLAIAADAQVQPAGGPAPRPIYSRTIAAFSDSIQPTGTIHWKNDGPFGTPCPHAEMKRLDHTWTLNVDGPDEARIRRCVDQAFTAAVLAAIIAAITTRGAAAGHAASSAALSTLINCLGQGYAASVDDDSHWVYWDT